MRVHGEFCTLFDVQYLPRGLVLYDSLRAACTEFRLRVLCMDEITKRVLDELELPSLVAVSLEELEADDPALAAVRQTRSPVEYCWTAVPSLCLFALQREPALAAITYLDADVRFYAPFLDELAEGSIVLVPHRYAKRWQWLERDSGPYNVQLVAFRRDQNGLSALQLWREQCIDWCYARVEGDRYGDQRYLDRWPEQFDDVRVLEHPAAGLAAWSSTRFQLDLRDGTVLVEGRPLLFYHFHGLRISRGRRSLRALERVAGARPLRVGGAAAQWASDFPLTRLEQDAIWRPYVELVAHQTERVRSLAPAVDLVPAADAGALARRFALRAPPPLPIVASRVLRAAGR